MIDQTSVARLTWEQVSARRLERSGLSRPFQDANPADVAGALCGAHAQIITAAEWSIGMRLIGAVRSDVQSALWEERSLVKTLGPRGTVHLLPARDLSMWTGALSAIPFAPNSFREDVRLTPGQTDEVVAAIAGALQGAELTIDELGDAVVARTDSWAGDLVMPAFGGMWPRWRQAIGTAANRGALCFGHNRGRKVTYTSPGTWVERPRSRSSSAGISTPTVPQPLATSRSGSMRRPAGRRVCSIRSPMNWSR
jgi:hypothetical protein